MSQVIEDMEMFLPTRTPYFVLVNSCRLGIFSNESHVSYSQNQIHIMKKSDLGGCFELVTSIVVHKVELSLQSTLMKNGEYFVVASGELRKNLYRSFLKTTFEPKMKLVINQQGRVGFKMHTFLSSCLEFRHSKQVPKIYKLIQRTYSQMMEVFQVVFEKVRPIIEPAYQKTIFDNPDRLERLDIIKNTCRFTYVQPSFMKHDGKRGKINHGNLQQHFIKEPELAVTNIYDMKVQSDKLVDDLKYKLFIELWQETYNLQKVQDTSLYKNFNLPKIKHIYQSNLKGSSMEGRPQTSKMQMHQQILSKIHIIDIEKAQWSKIYEGGFGYLYKANVHFYFEKEGNKQKKFMHEKPTEKVMIMKTDKSNNLKSTRIDIQKMILRLLKGQKCPYLPKFYQTSQKINKHHDFLLSEFYPYKSLDNWLNNFGDFTTIFTKLPFLIVMLYGLNFLHQNGIIHRDLKLGNILIDSKMVIKITDFGESFHESLQPYFKSKGRDVKPGFTFPYSPPQIYSKKEKLLKQTAYDMFSLGFIIFELIFGRSLFGSMKQAEMKKLYFNEAQNMNSKSYHHLGRFRSLIKQRIFLATQELAHFGPLQILTPILNVIERCLDPKVQNRPHLGWVIGIMKQIYMSLLDFYSF